LCFVYGSDLNPAQLRSRCVQPQALQPARLLDYRLAFFGYSRIWDGAQETVVPAPGHSVWGMLYALTHSDWDRLDAWQDVRLDGTGAYFHYPVRVMDSDGQERIVLLYRKDTEGEPQKPSREYLDFIAHGAEVSGLPPDYTADLRQFATQPASFAVPRRGQFDRALLVASPCAGCPVE
jgi:gamma-glutamylcyclotransferase (GGCT)/AIG2-like uncharacterized protein YtfP